ncbi:MAG: hypothetical protein JXP72_02170 [Coriobacteriia bacterium]|nr:hypothetical protein [Coriobacteriia bacterium]
MSKFWRADDGAVAVTVAVMLIVLVLFAAIAVDLGYLFTVRRQLQTAADAAALAGARLLAEGDGNVAILAEAAHYAEDMNGVAPAEDLWMVAGAPETEVGADFVQVTVAKDAPLFFGRVLGSSFTEVKASARAEIAYLTGVGGVVPWSAPIIRANRIAVRIDGGPDVWLTDQGGGLWSGTVTAPAAAADGYPVDVVLYNSQTAYPDGTSDYPDGVPEPVTGAAAVYVPTDTASVRAVWLDHPVVTAGETSSVTLYVRSSMSPSARFDGRNYNLDAVAGEPDLWRVALDVPASDDLHAVYPVEIKAGQGNASTEVGNAATLLVRRSTFPMLDVTLSDYSPAAGQAVTVSVRLHDYIYGERYAMRVAGGGGEVGNFCAIDLSTVRHTPYWMNPQHPAAYDLSADPDYRPPTYYNYLEKRYPFVIHIGDTIWTEPGAMSGPQTDQALQIRFGGDNRTFDQWVSDGSGASRRIVTVPIVEKMQLVTGTSPVRVVALAAFYVEPESDIRRNDIVGRFIEYVTPSDSISETPTDEFAITTVRLVPPQ